VWKVPRSNSSTRDTGKVTIPLSLSGRGAMIRGLQFGCQSNLLYLF
jgi:hypothetical protein